MANQKGRVSIIVNRHPRIFTFFLSIVLIFIACCSVVVISLKIGVGVEKYYSLIIDFEENYIQNKSKSSKYKLIETLNFQNADLEQGQKHTYSGENKNNSKAVIVSFAESNASTEFTVITTDTEGNEKSYSGGGGGSFAAYIDLKPRDTYRFWCEYYHENLEDDYPIHGKVNVYETVKSFK